VAVPEGRSLSHTRFVNLIATHAGRVVYPVPGRPISVSNFNFRVLAHSPVCNTKCEETFYPQRTGSDAVISLLVGYKHTGEDHILALYPTICTTPSVALLSGFLAAVYNANNKAADRTHLPSAEAAFGTHSLRDDGFVWTSPHIEYS
jgi:hypothetical protein